MIKGDDDLLDFAYWNKCHKKAIKLALDFIKNKNSKYRELNLMSHELISWWEQYQ